MCIIVCLICSSGYEYIHTHQDMNIFILNEYIIRSTLEKDWLVPLANFS